MNTNRILDAIQWTNDEDQKDDPLWLVAALGKPWPLQGSARIIKRQHKDRRDDTMEIVTQTNTIIIAPRNSFILLRSNGFLGVADSKEMDRLISLGAIPPTQATNVADYIIGKYIVKGVIINTDTGKEIQRDTPLFLLLGTDVHTPNAIEVYAHQCNNIYQKDECIKIAQEMMAWQHENPDCVHEPDRL